MSRWPRRRRRRRTPASTASADKVPSRVHTRHARGMEVPLTVAHDLDRQRVLHRLDLAPRRTARTTRLRLRAADAVLTLVGHGIDPRRSAIPPRPRAGAVEASLGFAHDDPVRSPVDVRRGEHERGGELLPRDEQLGGPLLRGGGRCPPQCPSSGSRTACRSRRRRSAAGLPPWRSQGRCRAPSGRRVPSSTRHTP